MATPLHGKDGYVYWNGTAVALVNNWNATFEYAYDDVTAMDSGGAHQRIKGLFDANGAVNVRYATDDTNGQTVMRANAMGGTAMVMRLYPNGTSNYFSGTAFLTMDLNVAHDAPDEATYNFVSHGLWTYT